MRWFWPMLAALSASCSSHPATQVLVVFHAEPGLRAEGERVHVRVENLEGEDVFDDARDTVDGPAGTVARVPLVPRGGDATRVYRITGVLLAGDGSELAHAEAVSGYVEDELREIHLWFDDACRGVGDCGDGRTCDRGVCVGACFEPTLPGESTRSEATCGECERCLGTSCEPLADGAACGCPESDRCNAGRCTPAAPVVSVTGSQLHTCAELQDHRVFCWGSNRVGQLGTGGPDTAIPAPVDIPAAGEGSAAEEHTCWLSWTGERRCWGWNGHGAIGDGTVESTRYDEPTIGAADELEWSAIDSGRFHTCALSRDSRIWCWGNNGFQQAGVLSPDEEMDHVPVPTPIEGDDWTAVAAGDFHSCGIREDTSVWCWGTNMEHRLGTDGGERSEPMQAQCFDGACMDGWEAVSGGGTFTCAIREGGELWCWGAAGSGQLGVGPVGDGARARQVEGRWQLVDAGASHTCGVRRDGSLWCWGLNVTVWATPPCGPGAILLGRRRDRAGSALDPPAVGQ